MAGPLAGVRVVELTGIGPGPFAAMLLGDLGAEVLRIDRPEGNGWPNPVIDRNRSVLVADLKSAEGRALCIDAARHADVLIEGYRPGVMERLGLGPAELIAVNPGLVYGRMTGWGQDGPLAQAAGHDINYIALTGALDAMGREGEVPPPPLNLVGDYGGGALYLALGIVAALLERERSGAGQVVDAAIVDGVASLMAMFSGSARTGTFTLERGRNLLAGRAPFYRCYRCKDGRDIAIGPLEPKFFAELVKRAGLPPSLADQQYVPAAWDEMAQQIGDIFRLKTRDEWCALLEGTDACFAPVLSIDEAPRHPHMAARRVYESIDGVDHPMPAPRFSRTPGAIRDGLPSGDALLDAWRRQPATAVRDNPALGGETLHVSLGVSGQ
jgi:alpha-methylacyl-CoA racemase